MTVYVIQRQTYDYRCDNSRTQSWNDWDDPDYVDQDYEEVVLKVAELNRELVELAVAALKAQIVALEELKAEHKKSESVFNTFTQDQKILFAASVPNYSALYQTIYDEINRKTISIQNLGTEDVGLRYVFEPLSLTRLEDIKNG